MSETRFVRLDDGTVFRVLCGHVVKRSHDGTTPVVVHLYDDGEEIPDCASRAIELVTVLVLESAFRL